MLGPWLLHQMYQQLILKIIPHWFFDKDRIIQMKNSILFHPDLDRILHNITLLYYNTGAPSNEQASTICSLVLMLDQGEHSITKWAENVANNSLLYTICGFMDKALDILSIMISLTVFGLVPIIH